MRLDKFIAENTGLTRSQATKAIRQSAVKINGEIVKSGSVQISQEDEIYFEKGVDQKVECLFRSRRLDPSS